MTPLPTSVELRKGPGYPEWYRGKDPLPEPTEEGMQALRDHMIAHINQGPVSDERERAGVNGSRGETNVQFMQRMKLGQK